MATVSHYMATVSHSEQGSNFSAGQTFFPRKFSHRLWGLPTGPKINHACSFSSFPTNFHDIATHLHTAGTKAGRGRSVGRSMGVPIDRTPQGYVEGMKQS